MTYTIMFNNVNLNASEFSLLDLTEILVNIRLRLSNLSAEFAQGVTSLPAQSLIHGTVQTQI